MWAGSSQNQSNHKYREHGVSTDSLLSAYRKQQHYFINIRDYQCELTIIMEQASKLYLVKLHCYRCKEGSI